MIPHCMDDFARRRQVEQAIQHLPIEPMVRPLHRGAYRKPEPIAPIPGPAPLLVNAHALRISDACLTGMAVLIIIIFGALAADYLGVW